MTTPTKISYSSTDAFQKDFKRLLKKFRSLEDDLETAKRNAIELYHLKNIDNHAVFRMPDFGTDEIHVYKIRKFACKTLKGRGAMSGIRIIYAYYPAIQKVEFIEIYFKSTKENEDRDRIKQHIKNLQ